MSNESGSDRAVRVPREVWGSGRDPWHGHIEGAQIDAGITVLFYANDTPGKGPKWHVHPYDELFVIRRGRALFTIGDRKIEAEEGDVLLGPRDVPHKFHNLGPGRLETVDVHHSPRWIQTDLPDPELEGDADM
ncbi:cupin domain-containing protein [Paracoccus alkanivorans]|uniref:Cupin domain-containing protein n=1 Tax=Paracoccus alkanivorans TaxID=2116655 RepID=A0A3M0MAN8_9RHOB|nr:cupin domain-containing protein [Paracoccus alkanivorans]RMC34866.1 cupin domain-containing protein [Paracoccus alkanivorans]